MDIKSVLYGLGGILFMEGNVISREDICVRLEVWEHNITAFVWVEREHSF
jgi:hypothetical protein